MVDFLANTSVDRMRYQYELEDAASSARMAIGTS